MIRHLITWGMKNDREAMLIPLALPAFIAAVCGVVAMIGGRV